MRGWLNRRQGAALGLAALFAAVASLPASAAWEPTRPVEVIVPAGTGGGADQMARTIQGIVTKHNLMKQPMVVVNKAGGAGAEGFLDVKSSAGNPHKLVITLSNLFTTPSAPASLQLPRPHAGGDDGARRVVLCVQRRQPLQDGEGLHRGGEGQARRAEMGGTGSKQEDQIITVAIEKATGAKFTYIPYRGGGEVAVQLVGKHVDSTFTTRSRPSPSGAARGAPALRLRRQAAALQGRDGQRQDLGRHPDLQVAGARRGILMLRGFFTSPRATKEQVDYYVELMKKVRETPEWQSLMKDGAFNQTMMVGAEYTAWVEKEEKRHQALMKDAGFLAGSQ